MKLCSQSLMLLVAALGLLPRPALGDGGTVRASERIGAWRVTVFTSPTPLRAGPVDFSVLVQDAKSGATVERTEVEVILSRPGGTDSAAYFVATREAATNKLFQDARFDLPGEGLWRAQVQVRKGGTEARLPFSFDAAGPRPRWGEVWIWAALPFPVVVLFGVHQVLVARERRTRVAGELARNLLTE